MSDELDELNELDGIDEVDEDASDLIELIDDNGKILNFKLLDVTEYKGVKYTFLLAAEPNEEIAEDEVVIFRLNEEDEVLEPIEDEALLEEVFNFYQQECDEEESDDLN